MSVQNGTRRQSWRQSGTSRTAGSGSVSRRRMITTLCLICLLLGAVALTGYLLSQRYQHTRIAWLFTASRSNTSEPEQAYTWPPLRFGSETLAPLLAQTSPQFEVASLTANFDNASNLVSAIDEQARQLQRNDALVLWIRAKGASLGGKAYLLSGDYHLPQSGEQLTDPQGAVPFKTIVDAVSRWSGPSIILLDWGNQLCDPRAGMWANQFLYLAMADIATAPPQVHCLVSHQANQISLDSLASHQTLFGRACAEALVGMRRAPAGFSTDVHADGKLLVGDLSEYVIRRVWSDSSEAQKPWLAKGQAGWMEAQRKRWQSLTASPLMQRSSQGQPLGWAAVEPADPSVESAAKASSEAEQTSAPAPLVLTIDNWPTGGLWETLDQWQAPVESMGGWSLASLAPLTARRLSAMIQELEQRSLAGDDFRGQANGANLRARIEALQADLQNEAIAIEQAARAGLFSAVLDRPPADVSPAEIANWQNRIRTVAAYRNLALILSDSVALSDNISQLEESSGDLRQATGRGIVAAKAFLQSVSTPTGESVDNLPANEAAALTRDLQKCKEDIDFQVARLVEQAGRNPQREKPLAEMLSRYDWLTHAQRSALLLSMMSAASADTDANWPTMDLALLQVKPPQLNQVAPPQYVDLVAAAMPALSADSAHVSTPEGLVAVLTQTAQLVRESPRVSEAQWLIVDGRDLCLKESGWPAATQQPPLPSRPQPIPAWRMAWENTVGGQFKSGRFELESTSQPASLDLMLARIGAAENIDTIEIRLGGLEGRVGGEDTPWLRGTLQLDRSALLRVVDLKANSQRLPIQIRALSKDPEIKRELAVRVHAGAASPPELLLACQLPVATPVAVVVQQRVCREGQTSWENCPQFGTLFTLQPFPGRQTDFRLLVNNQDSQTRTATVELYRLNSRAATNAKGRISETGQEVPLELENQDLRSFVSLVRSKPIVLQADQKDVEVDLSGPLSTPDTAAAGADQTTAAVEAASSPADLAWGLLAVVRLESEPNQTWRTWLQIKPVLADDFLSTSSRVRDDGHTIDFEIGLKDENRNDIPDWTPTDFDDKRPIVVECAIGSGVDLSQATLPTPLQTISKDKPRLLFTLSSESKIQSEVELQVNVDGSQRALFEFVGVGGRAARREPPDRLWLRSVGVKDGPTYIADFKRNLGEHERLFDTYGAMFRRPVPGTIDILLAVDAQSRRVVGAPPIKVNFQLSGATWQHSFGDFYGARDLQATLVDRPDNVFRMTCQLTDWKFEFDPRSLGDTVASFRGSAGASGERALAKLILDGLGPTLTRSVPAQEIAQGASGQLSFEVDDRIPIGSCKVLIGPAGKPAQAAPLMEPLSAKDFDPTPTGWRLRPQTLPVQEFAAGRYDLSVQIEDRLGNASTLGPWALTVRAAQPLGGSAKNGSPLQKPLQGNIQGWLHFGVANRLSPNPVEVSIKELPDKKATSSDGKFTITSVEAGEYTLVAKTKWQGTVYQGETKIQLERQADYQKLRDITLSK